MMQARQLGYFEWCEKRFFASRSAAIAYAACHQGSVARRTELAG
jgi:hypothetical protein